MTTTTPTPSVESLRGVCEVHVPGDPGYDAARMPWNVAVDQRPAAVALPRNADEVAAVVRAAASSGLRVAPQSTGHGAGPLDGADLSDVVLLRMSAFTGVTVDGDARTARVVGGTQWRDVAVAAAEHGLACMHGSAPDIGAAGYLTSGGLSFYGRSHGIAAGSVRAVEVVTADGEVVRADAGTTPDLFWAVRGGGANFGVVVAIEIDLLPYADVYAGMLLWPADRAPEVIRAWAAWARTAPESATTSLRVLSFPPLPELPPFLSGRDVVVIDGAVLEDDDPAAELLTPFRALAPEMDTFGRIPAPALLDVHMDPPEPTPYVSSHSMLGELTDEAVEAFVARVGTGSASGLFFAELRHLGGAFSRPVPDGGVVSHLAGEYALFCIAITPVPEAVAPGRAACAAAAATMAPWSVESLAPTFAEEAVEATALFGGEAAARLAGLRAQLDPAGVFLSNHPV